MEIKNNIFYVGVSNPNLKIFDIIMETKYGTSYNSYLIKDKEITLIDTIHENFSEEYILNISKIIDIKNIKYLILNHTEPDHSGSIEKLLNINPNIKIYCSSEAHKNICNMMNKDINVNIVKNDDILDIGNKTIIFKIAQFLHWPDSIFTYVKSDKVIFTGDFLGTHYTEKNKILDREISNKIGYLESAKYYYSCIFNPFKNFVKNGLNILKELDYEYIMPSHGPILKENINKIIDMYINLSSIERENKISIIYASAYGYTEDLAKIAKEYIEKSNEFKVSFLDVNKYDLEYIKKEIETSKGLFIGSPTLNRDVVKPIWDVLAVIDVYLNRGLVAGIFGAYAWSGEAINMIKSRLNLLGLKVIDDGIRVKFKASQTDIIQMQEYTKKVLDEIKRT